MSNPVILAINAGSSSIKYSLYEKTSPNTVSLLLNASLSGLTAPPSQFTYSLYQSSESHKDQGIQGKEIESSKAGDIDISNHEDAFKYFVEFLKNGKGRKEGKDTEGVIDLKRVTVVCHRIVHGGPEPRPLIITEEELHHLDELSDLAPLYMPSLFIPLSPVIPNVHRIPSLRSFYPYYPENSLLSGCC
jgi:acetate kinase